MSATLRALPAWRALGDHRAELGAVSPRQLFAADPGRAERMTFEAAGWTLDASKHLATERTLGLLLDVAGAVDLRGRIEAMFRGEPINIGIGGSDLGPAMCTQALRHYADPAMQFRFVSNVDATDFAEATRGMDPAGDELR